MPSTPLKEAEREFSSVDQVYPTPTLCLVLAGCHRGYRSGGNSLGPQDSSDKPKKIKKVHAENEEYNTRETEI